MERSINRLAKMPRQQFRSIGSHSGNDLMAAETNNNANISYNEVAGNNDLQSNMTGDPDYNSSLSKTPKTLFVLWQEWEVGIGGRKPAKLFTRVERGRVKFIYCRRKILWETVAMLVRGFHSMTKLLEVMVLPTLYKAVYTTRFVEGASYQCTI